jgi:hypothetical protein
MADQLTKTRMGGCPVMHPRRKQATTFSHQFALYLDFTDTTQEMKYTTHKSNNKHSRTAKINTYSYNTTLTSRVFYIQEDDGLPHGFTALHSLLPLYLSAYAQQATGSKQPASAATR